MDRRFLIILLVLIVGFFGIVLFQDSKEDSKPVGQGSNNVYGKVDSPVQLTEFVDFQCEACYAYWPLVKEVKEKYKDKVKFQVKNFPITSGHKNAMSAAKAGQAAANQGKFWEMHDLLFQYQKTWENTTDPTGTFEQYAEQIGLNMDQYRADVTSSETNSIVNADISEVQRLGGNGTPTFVLNGKKIESPGQNVDEFSKFLDEELKKAGVN